MRAQCPGKKIAVTVWGQRISPVFDSARTLLIAEIQGRTLVGTSLLTFDPERPLELLQMLRAQQVMLIICGAVSEGPASMLEAAGVELIPFIAGDVRHVLDHYLQGRSFGSEFRMPGCGKHICCRGKIRRGCEIGAGHGNPARICDERAAMRGNSMSSDGESSASESSEGSEMQD
jgi:predicted Fe-Mo cluster-binding NifX family protein